MVERQTSKSAARVNVVNTLKLTIVDKLGRSSCRDAPLVFQRLMIRNDYLLHEFKMMFRHSGLDRSFKIITISS